MSAGQIDKMFSVRDMVWWQGTSADHGQADIIPEHPPWPVARKLSGLDWDPRDGGLCRPADIEKLQRDFYEIMLADEPTDLQVAKLLLAAKRAHPKVEGWKEVYRDDTQATLACTMSSYPVISNSDFGAIFEAILEQPNVKFETGGCIDGGRKVWMLALLDEPIEIKGDGSVTFPYLALQARHDARGAVTLRATTVRIVCGNTFSAAELEGDRTGLTYSFTHRSGWQERVADAREAVTGARREFKAYAALAKELMLVKVTGPQTERFITSFFPAPPKGMASDRVMSNLDESRKRYREILASPTVAGAGIGGTAYGLVQAAGEYLDHVRGSRSWETKVNRSLLTSETQKARALQYVREACDLEDGKLRLVRS